MNEFFTTLYQTILGINNSNFSLIFKQLLNDGNYNYFAIIFIFIPLFIIALFYFLFKYPYAKWWYWLIVIAIAATIVWISTRQYAYVSIFETSNNNLNDALATAPGYRAFADPLPYTYANYNAAMSLIVSFIWSMLLRPFSKIQKHLPF